MYANHPIFLLSDELTNTLAELAPTMATYIGVPGHDHRFEDYSLKGHAHHAATMRAFRARLAVLEAGGDPWLELAKACIREQLDGWIDAHDAGDHLLDLNSIASPTQSWRMVFDVMDVESAAGWGNVASRLVALEGALSGYRETLAEGVRQGKMAAKRQVREVLTQCAVHTGDAGWFAGLPAQVGASAAADETLKARVTAGAARARAAFADFARFLEHDYLPHAPVADAVGPERYARAARAHLGMKLDAREAYAWGWDEIRRLESAMRDVAKKIDPAATVPELVARLKKEPTLRAASAEDFVEQMTARQLQALQQLDGSHFDLPPAARHVDVKIAPPGGPLGAYYTGASEDFSRPGCIWYSMGEDRRPALFTEISTAYHEGFPGHHLQISIQIAQADKLSRFQRMIAGNNGHCEGWALYAEQLMRELGYLERPEYELGMLIEQLVRAWRVVVDIGLHLSLPIPADSDFHPGAAWDADLMHEAIHKRAFQADDHSRSEVVRYMGWPAQAISYKIGQRVLLDLRAERQRAEGEGFSLKRFHARVLEVGSVGLDLLVDLVRART